VGNWPGVTVELIMAQVAFDRLKFTGLEAQVVDLPGICDLPGFSEDEAVVQRFLETTPISMIVVILNATQLDRRINLALQAKQLAVPMVFLLRDWHRNGLCASDFSVFRLYGGGGGQWLSVAIGLFDGCFYGAAGAKVRVRNLLAFRWFGPWCWLGWRVLCFSRGQGFWGIEDGWDHMASRVPRIG
jgi:hypothetical protein